MNLFIFQNAPAPYRIPLLERLSKKFYLTVVYGTKSTPDRFWHMSLNNSSFNQIFLEGVNIHIKNKILTYVKGLNNYLKKNIFDVYIINDDLRCILSNITILRRAKANHKPVTLWCGAIHSAYRRNNMFSKLYMLLFDMYIKFTSKYINTYLAYGPKNLKYYNQHYKIPNEKLIWGTQAIDLDKRIIPTIDREEIDKVHFLYLGYLEERKGLRDLISAVNLIKDKNYKLTFAGKGKEENILKEMAKDTPNIEFIGYVENEDKIKCLNSSDVMILPTYHDPWANTINEACLYSMPIITTFAAGAEGSLAIHGLNAVVVPPGDIEKLKEAIEFFIINKDKIPEMGNQSKILADKFNFDWVVENFSKAISMANANMSKVRIGNIYIDNLTMNECIAKIENFIVTRSKTYIVTPNVDHIVKLDHDNEFFKAYKHAKMILADGMPIIWTSKLLGTPLKEKISGSDLFPKLCKMSGEKGYKLFFLGGREGVAKQAAVTLQRKINNLKVVGTYSPPFDFEKNQEENEKILKMINILEPDILFVGVGAPKQEKWIYKNIDKLNAIVSIGIGASFDFEAGTVKRAPKFMQKIGLEWFWRFINEPNRLFKRYFIDDSKFIYIILRQMLFKKKD